MKCIYSNKTKQKSTHFFICRIMIDEKSALSHRAHMGLLQSRLPIMHCTEAQFFFSKNKIKMDADVYMCTCGRYKIIYINLNNWYDCAAHGFIMMLLFGPLYANSSRRSAGSQRRVRRFSALSHIFQENQRVKLSVWWFYMNMRTHISHNGYGV